MSTRVKPEWIWVGLAFVIMCAVPWLLLSEDEKDTDILEPLMTTQVQMQDIVVVDTLLTKPLFNSSRKVMEAGPPDTEALADASQPQMGPAPTLVGLVSKRRGKAIAIIKTHEGETKNLTKGQSSDGWTLVSVRKNAAVFANAGENRTIALDYSNKALGGPGGDAASADELASRIDNGEIE